MNFENKYNNIKQLASGEIKFIEEYMVQYMNTTEPLNTHLINFLTAPSKRIRPLLSILFYKSMYGKINEKQLKALSVIELIHSASLIHDDIIDESDTRRGLKTLSNQFGNKLGVISGDYLLSTAMKILTEIGVITLIDMISDTMNKMCIGEIDQNFTRFKIGTIEDYIEKSKNKTAYLFETALVTPFLINNSKNDIASNFGLNAGIAFQIRDDLLNLIQNDNSKPTRNDIKDGIYNAPVIYSGSTENYIAGVEKTKDLLNNYINNATLEIKGFEQNEYTKGLEDFLELLKYE
jgi:geranylgeranyl pyrophosphate synthase